VTPAPAGGLVELPQAPETGSLGIAGVKPDLWEWR
jgi:hypothetical protein